MPEDPRVLADDAAAIHRTMAALKPNDERALLRHLSPEIRAALWRHHLETFVADHPELNDEQRAVIEEGRELLSHPDFFSGNHAGLEEHKARSEAAFPPELIYRLFFRLGG